MELCIFTEPQQGASYDDQLAHATLTERLGFHGWFRSDHILVMGETDPLPGPTDAWVTLAGLARETERIRLGTLVSSATFRHPSLLAIQVAQVDAMSGGRVDFGLGTGWFAEEHEAYGVPFPARRFGMFEEQLAVLTGLWSTPIGETLDFVGEHYTLKGSPALPKPAQSRMPVISAARDCAARPRSRLGSPPNSTSASAPKRSSPQPSTVCEARASRSVATRRRCAPAWRCRRSSPPTMPNIGAVLLRSAPTPKNSPR